MRWSTLTHSLRLTARRFTDRAVKTLNVAVEQAAERKHSSVSSEHVLFAIAIIERGPGRLALERLGLDLAQERDAIAELLNEIPQGEMANPTTVSADVEQMVEEAVAQARALKHNYVGTEHLTLALVTGTLSPAGRFLARHGVTHESLREAVLRVLSDARKK